MKHLTILFLLITGVLSAQSGNVGINTPNPKAKLDINGNFRVRVIPQGTLLDSVLVVSNGYVRKIAISSIIANCKCKCNHHKTTKTNK